MNMITVTFVLDEELKVYSAYIDGIPVCGEGKNKEESLQSLKEGMRLYMEDVGREEMFSQIIGPVEHQEVDFGQLV